MSTWRPRAQKSTRPAYRVFCTSKSWCYTLQESLQTQAQVPTVEWVCLEEERDVVLQIFTRTCLSSMARFSTYCPLNSRPLRNEWSACIRCNRLNALRGSAMHSKLQGGQKLDDHPPGSVSSQTLRLSLCWLYVQHHGRVASIFLRHAHTTASAGASSRFPAFSLPNITLTYACNIALTLEFDWFI